jgi:hypothetical protein
MSSKLQTDKPSLAIITRQRWREVLLWGIIGVCAGMLIWLAALGQYVRPFQDDFYYYPPSSSKEASDLLHERYHWTGRFSTTTTHLAVGWSQTHWIVPFISLTVMGVGIFALSYVLMSRFLTVQKKLAIKLALLAGLGLTLIIFLVTPSPYSSIFWLSGAPIHFWSYGLVFIYAAYLLKCLLAKGQKLKPYDYMLFITVPVAVGMFGEMAMFTLLALAAIILVAAAIYKSKKFLYMALANIVGVGVAFYALFFSLGAVIRRGAEKAAPLQEVITHAPYVIAKNFHALLTSLMANKLLLVVTLAGGIILGLLYMKKIDSYRKVWLYVGGISIILLGLVCLNFVAVYSSVRFNVAWSRTQAFSVIILISCLMVYGVIIGGFLRQKLNQAWTKRILHGMFSLITLIVVMNVAFIPYIQTFTKSIQTRAVEYDIRERYIEQARDSLRAPCPVLPLKTTYLWGTQETFDLASDPLHALNQGVKRYYNLPCNVSGVE